MLHMIPMCHNTGGSKIVSSTTNKGYMQHITQYIGEVTVVPRRFEE